MPNHENRSDDQATGNVTATPSAATSMTRRAAIKTVSTIGGAVVSAAAAEGMKTPMTFVSELVPAELHPHRMQKALALVSRLVGDITRFSAAPGIEHPDYFARFIVHPDQVASFSTVRGLLAATGVPQVEVPLNGLLDIDPTDSLLLIGGPLCNAFARGWQGYYQAASDKYLYDGRSVPRRWRFEYNLENSRDSGPARYVGGERRRSWLQSIYDDEDKILRFAGAAPASKGHLLTEDWLILSYVPNPNPRAANQMILDASDLYGQGEKAFARLLHDPDQLQELANKLEKAGVRSGDSFQALFRVSVVHNHDARKTMPGDCHLYDVAALPRLRSS